MNTLNVSNQMLQSKRSLDEFKTCMEKCFENVETTDLFITYAINDVTSLKAVSEKMLFLFLSIFLQFYNFCILLFIKVN
jgi:hypothetical protein